MNNTPVLSEFIMQRIAQSRYESVPMSPAILKHKLAKLDTLEGTIRADDSIDIVGVVIGVKPAASLYAPTPNHSLLYRTIAENFSLVCRDDRANQVCTISRYEELADELAVLLRATLPKSTKGHDLPAATEYAIGALLGYPKAATDTYLERLRIHRESGKFPKTFDVTEYGDALSAFVQFILPENPQDRSRMVSDYIVPLHDTVRCYMPQTYRAIQEMEHLPE